MNALQTSRSHKKTPRIQVYLDYIDDNDDFLSYDTWLRNVYFNPHRKPAYKKYQKQSRFDGNRTQYHNLGIFG